MVQAPNNFGNPDVTVHIWVTLPWLNSSRLIPTLTRLPNYLPKKNQKTCTTTNPNPIYPVPYKLKDHTGTSKGTEHNDTRQNGTEYNDNQQHDTQHNDTQHNDTQHC
jgi:hypothetical protein